MRSHQPAACHPVRRVGGTLGEVGPRREGLLALSYLHSHGPTSLHHRNAGFSTLQVEN